MIKSQVVTDWHWPMDFQMLKGSKTLKVTGSGFLMLMAINSEIQKHLDSNLLMERVTEILMLKEIMKH